MILVREMVSCRTVLIGLAAASACVPSSDEEAPPQLVEYGAEPWHRGTVTDGTVDVANVIERVQHAIRVDAKDGIARVTAAGYTAAFDARGLYFTSGDSSLGVRTARIAMGERVIYEASGEVEWTVVGNTAQARVGSLVEHHESRTDGVELTWVLRERPAELAELVVDAQFERGALSFAGTTEHGTHFADPAGNARVRIGAATLVDAAQRTWPVSAEVTDEGMRWRVPADILEQASFPIALDPVIGPEFGMDAPVAVSGASEDQYSPTVASNGTGYLVAWVGYRGIYGARVSPAGIVLDPLGMPISVGTWARSLSSAASNGTDYFVTWQDSRNTDPGLYGARITAGGVVVDPVGIRITGTQGSTPSVASNGTDYLVAWSDLRNNSSSVPPFNYDVFAARVTVGGIVMEPTGIALVTDLAPQYAPSVASNGTDYLVAWEDYRSSGGPSGDGDIYARRVTASGVALDPSGILIEAALPLVSVANALLIRPSVASNGTDYLVVWPDNRNLNTRSLDIFGARLTAAGSNLDPTGRLVGSTEGVDSMPAVSGTAQRYLVAWSAGGLGSGGTRATRVLATGAIEGGEILVSSRVGDIPALGSDGADFFVAWRDLSSSSTHVHTGNDIYGARVRGSTGEVLDPSAVALGGPNAQYAPAVGANSTGFFVAWQDNRNTTYDIYGARLSPAGQLLDPNGIAISQAVGSQFTPSVAGSGTGFLVTWRDLPDEMVSINDVRGARVSNAGALLDTNGIAVTNTGSYQIHGIRAASDGTNYFVAWSDYLQGSNVYGTPITAASGAVTQVNGTLLSSDYNNGDQPTIASNGTNYLVAWYDNDGIYGGLFSPSTGALLQSLNISIGTYQIEPAVASNGTDYLVTWTQEDSPAGTEIYATRVSGTGTVDPLDYRISTLAGGRQEKSLVASVGDDYFVIWNDYRAGQDVFGSRVSATGAVGDPTGLMIAEDIDYDTVAFTASPNLYMVVYGAYTRVRARLISNGCSDGVKDALEGCDDGNAMAGDGCSASCGLEPGYACGAPATPCVDIDECMIANGGCEQRCDNLAGGFTCGCNTGYVLDNDGIRCQDVDECATNNGGCSGSPHADCINTVGSSTCGPCPAGYTGDGKVCTDLDECTAGTDTCGEHTVCANTSGSYSCPCAPGYLIDGAICADIDECSTNQDDCTSGQTCTNTTGTFECSGGSGSGSGGDKDSGGGGCSTGHPSGLALVGLALLFVRRRGWRLAPIGLQARVPGAVVGSDDDE